MSKKGLQLLFFIVIVLVLFIFFGYELNLYLKVEYLHKAKEYFLAYGNWAPLIMIGIYILFNIAAIPRVFFTIFSGYVFGVFYGFIFAWIATMAGLIVSFLLVRYLFRESFERRFGDKNLVEKFNLKIDKNGLWLIVFLRAIYIIPSSVLNYTFGFTKIKTLDYIVGSGIGFIPVVLVNVLAGNAFLNNLEKGFTYELLFIFFAIMVLIFLFQKFKLPHNFIKELIAKKTK